MFAPVVSVSSQPHLKSALFFYVPHAHRLLPDELPPHLFFSKKLFYNISKFLNVFTFLPVFFDVSILHFLCSVF